MKKQLIYLPAGVALTLGLTACAGGFYESGYSYSTVTHYEDAPIEGPTTVIVRDRYYPAYRYPRHYYPHGGSRPHYGPPGGGSRPHYGPAGGGGGGSQPHYGPPSSGGGSQPHYGPARGMGATQKSSPHTGGSTPHYGSSNK